MFLLIFEHFRHFRILDILAGEGTQILHKNCFNSPALIFLHSKKVDNCGGWTPCDTQWAKLKMPRIKYRRYTTTISIKHFSMATMVGLIEVWIHLNLPNDLNSTMHEFRRGGVRTPTPGKSHKYRVPKQYWSGSPGKSQNFQATIHVGPLSARQRNQTFNAIWMDVRWRVDKYMDPLSPRRLKSVRVELDPPRKSFWTRWALFWVGETYTS